MAPVAVGRQGSLVVVRVASRAGNRGMSTRKRETRCVVIESRIEPCACGVALSAVLRKAGSHVVWNTGNGGRVVVILSVASVTVGRQGSLVVVGVASGAGYGGMRAGKRKNRCIVIEGRIKPRDCRVATGTVLRESGIDVIGHPRHRGRVVVVLHMAAIAVCGQGPRIVVRMAGGAGHRGVCAAQGESGLAMVKRRRYPPCSRVACIASCRKAACNVVRVGGALKVLGVAAIAEGRSVYELVVDVAQIAGDRGMHAGQRVTGKF